MLSPKKTKYRKQFKGKIHGHAKGGFTLNFGSYGLKSVEPERITARQIEAARRAITRQMKRQGRVWIRIVPDVPVNDTPRGSGAQGHRAHQDPHAGQAGAGLRSADRCRNEFSKALSSPTRATRRWW